MKRTEKQASAQVLYEFLNYLRDNYGMPQSTVDFAMITLLKNIRY